MPYQLIKNEFGLSVTLSEHPDWTPFQIDFSQGSLFARYRRLQGKNELIAKAIGWKKNQMLQVYDVTAGLGREAFLLAALGCHVTLIERHPVIAALLKDALERAKKNSSLKEVIARMQLVEGCAITTLSQLTDLPDVIYCDPMFPERSKSAAVKKEMQVLQAIVGEDQDVLMLVKQALIKAKRRVVIKRPKSAPWLCRQPDVVFAGRSHRYDVYLSPKGEQAELNV